MTTVHLLVLVHGMWGNPSHLSELNRVVREKNTGDAPSLHVILAETNSEDSTYDGIDWGGERVAQEIIQEVERLAEEGKKVTNFSITGYSLGGLVSRYVIGILSQKGFFREVTPVNFNTIATPHLGLVRYPSFISSVVNTLGPKLLSRTGEQFYCMDKWYTTERPLLDVMADPEFIFYQVLASFKHIRIYANAVDDLTVPYVTAAIELDDPFAECTTNGLEIEFEEKYKPIIKSYHLPPVPPPPTPKPVLLSPAWFRRKKASKPFLPPFLQFRFPLNILFYASLPLLIPIVLSLVIYRLSMAARSSRARIQILEQDTPNGQTLAQTLAHFERQIEDAVIDFIEDPGVPNDENSGIRREKPGQHPIIKPLQRKMAFRLNKLPLLKERAFIEGLRNTHATIISRDVKRFDIHRIGEGVIRHWADSLVV